MNIGRENELIEFKKSTSETKEGVVSIASILNKHGYGTLYFGVRDNGDVIGQEIGKDTERKLSRDIADNIRPAFRYEIKMNGSSDGKSFIEVSFSGSAAPYSAYGKYYQRYADEDKQISDFELERLFRSRQKDYSAWENADSDETAADADEERLKKIISDGNDSGRIKYEYTERKAILSKLGLLGSDGRLNNAGKTLLSKNRPVLLKTAIFATETKDTFLKLNHFEGNIFECIDEGLDFVLSALNWNIVITGNARRKEEPEIPQEALREMIVNAFAHGCYDSNTAFAIEVFRDKVVIYSPGLFPSGYTPEDFARNNAEPVMLNPKIVNVLFKSAVIESFGSGYERTFASLSERGLEYGYENTRTGFRFILYRPCEKGKKSEMTENERKVYSLLKECDCLSAGEIAEKIGKSEKTVYRTIKALKESGTIRREGNDKDGYWKILK